MTEFGQNNPAVPNIYWNQSFFAFTKTGFVSHMCRALKTVGMVPLTYWWPYDALDPANAEIVRTPDSNNFSTDIFAFDFPDSSTFTINDNAGTPTTWRPFICVVAYYGNFTSSVTASNQQNEYVRIESGIRSSGALSLNDSRGRWRQFTANNNGWGRHSDISTVSGAGGLGDLSRGMFIQKIDWKPYASYAGAGDVNTLGVKNIFVYLGKAGLFIYVGTGSTRGEFGSLMAAGFAFGGARLPGRALAVDPNLNRINPIVNLAMLETETEMNVVNTSWRAVIQGIQHDQVSTFGTANNDWAWADVWNLENAEIPFYPSRRVNTVPSPRRLSSGQGAHILGRPVIMPKELFSNSAILFGPLIPQASSSDTRPTFAEVFTCPGLRFTDTTAPLGDYQEPETLENWRIVPWPSSTSPLGSGIALYSENAYTVSTLFTGSRTVLDLRDYVFNGQTTATGTNAFAVGSPVTLASNPSGISASAVHISTTGTMGTARWQLSALTNESPSQPAVLYVNSTAYSTSSPNGMTGFTATGTLTLQLTINPLNTDPVDSLYDVQITMRVRGGTQDQHNFTLGNVLNAAAFTASLYDTVDAVSRSSIATSGALTTHYAYNYRTYSAQVVRDPFTAGSPIVLQFNANRTADTNDATLIEINAVTIRRSRYL